MARRVAECLAVLEYQHIGVERHVYRVLDCDACIYHVEAVQALHSIHEINAYSMVAQQCMLWSYVERRLGNT